MPNSLNKEHIEHLYDRIMLLMENQALHLLLPHYKSPLRCEDCARYQHTLTGLFDLLKMEDSLIIITSNLAREHPLLKL
jgi:hypothetical protein